MGGKTKGFIKTRSLELADGWVGGWVESEDKGGV